MSTPSNETHSIYFMAAGARRCSCGEWFPASDPLGALRHALPLNVERLNTAVQADPNSPPEMRARSAALLQEVREIP